MRIAMALFVVGAASVAGCGGGGGAPDGAAPAASHALTPVRPATSPGAPIGASPGGAMASMAKRHDIRGRVEAVSRASGMVTLDHEEIPGVMAAMKMEYAVADRALLDRLTAGDRVEGRLEERAGSYVIVEMKKR